LAKYLFPLLIAKTDQVHIPSDARKPMECGLLAALTVDGVPANLPLATGTAGARLLGSITPGSPTNWSRCLAWMLSQAPPSSNGWDKE
jgi:anhydro-N-acetylmuramic acid kinase